MSANTATRPQRRPLDALALTWLALPVAWSIVILLTDQLAWPIALWIATTVGPLTWFKRRSNTNHQQN